MKARTKEERFIETLEFPNVDFSKIKIFKRKGYQTQKGITCLKCGNEFSDLVNKKCPHCGEKLEVERTRKQVFNETKYIQVITTNGDYQVIRIYLAILEARKGQEENFKIVEVMRWFINPKGKIKLMTIATTQFYYEWNWVLSRPSDFSFAKIYDQYKYCKWKFSIDITYPKMKFTDKFKYCGYNKKIALSAISYFETYLKYPKIEIFAKLGRGDFINYFYQHKNKDLDKYSKAIKTVIKTKYKPKKIDIWIDYLDALLYFNKDISSPKYCCPKDLLKAHDTWLDKKDWFVNEKDYVNYRSRVEKFKGIDIGKDNISIVVIPNIEQMKHEARLLKLCYITSKYYNSENSLILSARVDGEPTEGIEISIDTQKVIQIRGKGNEDSPYHEQIESLVNKNKHKLFEPIKEEKAIEHSIINGEISQGSRTEIYQQQPSLCAI